MSAVSKRQIELYVEELPEEGILRSVRSAVICFATQSLKRTTI